MFQCVLHGDPVSLTEVGAFVAADLNKAAPRHCLPTGFQHEGLSLSLNLVLIHYLSKRARVSGGRGLINSPSNHPHREVAPPVCGGSLPAAYPPPLQTLVLVPSEEKIASWLLASWLSSPDGRKQPQSPETGREAASPQQQPWQLA